MKVCSLPVAGTLAIALSGLAATRLYGGGLQPQGAEYQLTRGVLGDQVRPRVSLDERGGWLLWQDAAIDGQGLGIAGTRLGPMGGATQGATFAVNQVAEGDQENPAVVALPEGGAFAVWQGGRQGFSRIFGRRLGANGLPSGDEVGISQGDGEHQIDPAVALLGDGSIIVAWASYRQDGSQAYDIFGRRLNLAGQPLSSEFRINATLGLNRRSPAVAGLPGGGFLCAWISERQVSATSALAGTGQRVSGAGAPVFDVALVARPFGVDGTPHGTEQRVSGGGTLAAHPVLAALPNGAVMAAWSRKDSVDTASKLDIACRLLEPNGTAVGDERIVNTTRSGDQYAPSLAASRLGVMAIWTSMGQDGSWEGIFGRWIGLRGVPSGDEIPVNGQTGGGQLFPAVAAGPDSNLVVAWSSNLPRVGYEVFAQRLAPLLLRAEHSGTGRLRLNWGTVLGGVYQLQVSRDGQTWSDVGGTRTAISESDSTEIPASGQVVLYRVVRTR